MDGEPARTGVFAGFSLNVRLAWLRMKIKASKGFNLGGTPSRAATIDECMVIVSYEPNGWHLSISHPSRNPTWEEIRTARYELVPDQVKMAMILPPKAEYVNVHEFCFHLYEIKQ
jgi:hypothetical protein